MAATQTPARQTYRKLPVPLAYDKAYWDKELGNVQLALSPVAMRTATSATTANVTDAVILCDATGGAFTVSLFDPSRVKEQQVTVKKIDASGHAITIQPMVGLIDGASTQTISAQYKALTMQSDGATWWIVNAF